MRIIPVIDLMGGRVVRGIAGRRSEYRPIESTLVRSAAPVDVATAFLQKLKLPLGYLADLDAIAGGEPSWTTYEQLLASGFNFWLDAGVQQRDQARRLAEFSAAGERLAGIVVGLESVATPEALAEIALAIEPERRIFSLDLRAGRPLIGQGWPEWGALDIAEWALAAGFTRFIVLDLAFVGVEAGPGGETLCRVLHRRFPEIELIGGGGVRNVDDLSRLSAAGCTAALVASALHNGAIGRAEMAALASMISPSNLFGPS